MKYHSSRGQDKVELAKAISSGLAQNGGLFVPESFPDLSYLKNEIFSL